MQQPELNSGCHAAKSRPLLKARGSASFSALGISFQNGNSELISNFKGKESAVSDG